MARPIGSARDSDPAFWDPVGRRLGGPRACVALLHLPARCICSCQRHAAATTRRALALERVVSLAVPVPEMAALELRVGVARHHLCSRTESEPADGSAMASSRIMHQVTRLECPNASELAARANRVHEATHGHANAHQTQAGHTLCARRAAPDAAVRYQCNVLCSLQRHASKPGGCAPSFGQLVQ